MAKTWNRINQIHRKLLHLHCKTLAWVWKKWNGSLSSKQCPTFLTFKCHLPRQPLMLVFTDENRAHRTWDRSNNRAITTGLALKIEDQNKANQNKRGLIEKWVYLATLKPAGHRKGWKKERDLVEGKKANKEGCCLKLCCGNLSLVMSWRH